LKNPLFKLCAFIMAVAVALIAWKLLSRPSDTPIEAIVQNDYPEADNVAFFLQNDPAWSDDFLGSTGYTMGGSGCLVTCIAASLSAQGIDTDPGRLNRAFTQEGVYNCQGEIVWNHIEDAIPNVRVSAPAKVDVIALEQAVAQGRFPIVKVRYKGVGYQHWVILIGARNGHYLCMDPLNGDKQPLPLSAHGGVIYRSRIVDVNPNPRSGCAL